MKPTNPYQELEAGMFAALETYSNVHRGSGHFSKTTTHLYEKAREITLSFMGLKSNKYMVIFLTPRRFSAFTKGLTPDSYVGLHSRDFGLNLGVSSMAVKKKSLPVGAPIETGGGTTKLYGTDWVMWANAPDRFEAGTPAIINIIAFAKALMMIRQYGNDIFMDKTIERVTTTNENDENVTAAKETVEEVTTWNEAFEEFNTGNETIQEVTARKILYEDHLTPYHGKELMHSLCKTLIGREVRVPTTKGLLPFVNLDNSASTQTFLPVWDAFRQTYHQPEKLRKKIIEEVKDIIAETMGAPLSLYDIHFTSNTTEAINLAAQSLSNETSISTLPANDNAHDASIKPDQTHDTSNLHTGQSHDQSLYPDGMAPSSSRVIPGSHAIMNGKSSQENIEPVILTTNLEHSSNDLPWRQVAGHTVIRLGVDNMGFFDHDELESLLRSYNKDHLHGKQQIRLVTVSGASNVLGSCNDLSAFGRFAKKYGARLFVDAAQLAAHRKIDMQTAGIDCLAFTAHKVYAPFGAGVLITRKGLLQISDEEMAVIHASALENAGGIAALGKALLFLNRIGFGLIEEEEKRLTEKALYAMSDIPGAKIFGELPGKTKGPVSRIGVIGFEIKDKMPSRIAQKLARRGGIGLRMGCHCAHLIIKQLAGFTTFQEKLQRFILRLVPILSLQGITRISLGIQNTDTDIEMLIRELIGIATPHHKHAGFTTPSTDNKAIVHIPESLVKKQVKEFIRSREREVF